jgi:hypothetical protein
LQQALARSERFTAASPSLPRPSLVTYVSVIDQLVKCEGLSEALEMLQAMRHEHALQPDEKLWTTVIRALAKLCVTGGGSGERSPSIDCKRPLSLLEQALSDMRSAGFVPSMSLYPTTTTTTTTTTSSS